MRGLLPVWKEKGMTSHDVVFRLRKILKMKKIGHTGTLDPDVEGVLLICLGEGTKLVELLMDSTKHYQGTVTLGYSTETEDVSGQIVAVTPVVEKLSLAHIDEAMRSMEGMIEQVPPYYSAVKVNGKKLYEYARNNEKVERPIRQVSIESFKRTSELHINEEKQTVAWDFDVICGKGTYVRTLAVDLGAKLGYASHMSALTRIETGGVDASQALTLAQIQAAVEQQMIDTHLISIESALSSWPSIHLLEQQFHDVRHGKILPNNYFIQLIVEPTVLFYQNRAVAIYYPHPDKQGLIKPLRMFVDFNEKVGQA